MWEIFDALLRSRGITAAEFSRETGISQVTLSTWKKRGGPIGSRHAQTIADFFGVSVDYLMTGKRPDLAPVTAYSAAAKDLITLIEKADENQIEMTADFLRRMMAYKEGLENVLAKDKNG